MRWPSSVYRRIATIVLMVANLLAILGVAHIYLTIGLDGVDGQAASLIVRELRVPRMLCAIGVGALLSISGVLMQGVFRNPLVEPYTMGISGGAVLGVAVAFASGLVSSFGGFAVSASSAVGGLSTLAVVLVVRRFVGGDIGAMLMCGIMVSFTSSAATSIILSLASREDVSQVFAWTMGSFSAVGHADALVVFCVACLAVPLSALAGNALNVLSLGDDEARALGVSPDRVAAAVFIVATLLTSLAVSVVGVVAFVGMAVPHFARKLYGQDYRVVSTAAGLLGALALLVCDLLSKEVVSPKELPAGAVCAVFGGVMFTYLTLRWKKTDIL